MNDKIITDYNKLHPKQKEILKSNKRIVLFQGSRIKDLTKLENRLWQAIKNIL
jgi:hypothetical protein